MAMHKEIFAYPLMFVLVNTKREEAYVKIFREIKDCLEANEYHPKDFSLTMDFERGLINAAKRELSGIKIIGCGFHFLQRLKKNLNNSKFLFDDDLWRGFRSLVYKFLSKELDFDEMMEKIHDFLQVHSDLTPRKIQEIEKYMNSDWRSKERFLYGNRTEDFCSWTNNFCESFNNKLNTLGDRSSKSSIEFISDGLLKITDQFLNKILSADHLKKNPTASARRIKKKSKRRNNLFIEEPMQFRSQNANNRVIERARKIIKQENVEQNLNEAKVQSLELALEEAEKKRRMIIEDEMKSYKKQLDQIKFHGDLMDTTSKNEADQFKSDVLNPLFRSQTKRNLKNQKELKKLEKRKTQLKKELNDARIRNGEVKKNPYKSNRISIELCSSIEKIEDNIFMQLNESENEKKEIMVIRDQIRETKSKEKNNKKTKKEEKKKKQKKTNKAKKRKKKKSLKEINNFFMNHQKRNFFKPDFNTFG